MAIVPILKSLFGGMDKNSNPENVAPNNYVDAVDVTDKSVREENGQKVWQLNNNVDYAFNVGSVVAQNKIYRLSIDFTVDAGVTTPTDTNIVLVIEKAGAYKELLTLNDGGSGLPISTWRTDITDALTTDNPLLLTNIIENNVIGNKLTIDFECEYFGNTDWIFNAYMEKNIDGTFYYSTDWKIVVDVLQDAFSAEKEGDLTRIMMSNKGNEVICFNTTGNKEPVQESVFVQFNGGVWEVSTSLDFINGEEVFLSGTSDDTTIVVSTFFTIVPHLLSYKLEQTINPIDSIDIIGDGTYKLNRFTSTASTIGVARKNENSGEWNYLELLRSNKLNFRTYNQIRDAIITSTDFGVNNDWTDGLNPIRRLLYKGDWMENGYLTVYNPNALYSLDTIGEESKLQLGQNTSKITMSVSHVGGTKPEATYISFVRFGSKVDGVQTGWSHYSNSVWTHSNALSVHYYGNSTTFSLIINVEQIPLNQFDIIQIGVIEVGSKGNFKSYILPEESVSGLTEISITDTGDTTKYISWDAATEVEIPLVVFEHANNLLDFDNYIIAGDVKLSNPYDLSDWASKIELSVAVRTMQITTDYAEYQQSFAWLNGGYNNEKYMSNEWLSDMPSEWRRIAVAIDWKNGAPTSYFPIKDIYIDPTLTDYQITDDSDPIVNVYQYYLEATGININYLLPDGQLVKDVVKDIRFARTKVVKEVLATGIAISTQEKDSKRYLTYLYPDSNLSDSENLGDILAFYSPDLINNGETIQFQSGDQLIGIAPTEQKSYVLPELTSGFNLRAVDYFGNKGGSYDLQNNTISKIQDIATGQNGELINLSALLLSLGVINDNVKFLGCVSISLGSNSFIDNALFNAYYKRPISTGIDDSPYKTSPLLDKYFIVPQDIWYDEATHSDTTTYKIFGGDCYPQKQYYRIGNDFSTSALNDRWANLIGFYSYNRTNGAMRSGFDIGHGFPTQSVYNMLTDSSISDDYTIDSAFLLRNQFQSKLPYNPNALYTTNTISTIYYSGKRLNGALYGNNRVWKFNDNGVIENVYGRITDLSILLGTSGNNAIFVKQERNTTLQYFDNTARLITTSVEAILGTGGILDTKGTFLTVSGSSHKFAKAKCLSPTSNKEFDIWFDVNTRTFNRFGADGSRVISDDISSFLLKHTTLANLNEYNNPDRPAHDYGILARWDNQKKEYVCTFRLIAKNTLYSDAVTYSKGQIVSSGETFGFENIPILYKSKTDYNVDNSLSNTVYWEKYNSYIDDLHQCYTLVWNELDNAWKGFYSYLPNIYGNAANNYLSGHPTSKNLVYEHNQDNEARYYCSIPQIAPDDDVFMWFHGIGTFNIGGETFTSTDYIMANDDEYNIAGLFGITTFPYDTTIKLNNHISYYVYDVNVKRYYRIKSFLSDNVWTIDKNENIYVPNDEYTPLFYYSTCNTGQPLIEGIVNENQDEQSRFLSTTIETDLTPPRLDLKTKGQVSYNIPIDFDDYTQDRASVAFGYDTTNNPEDNMADTSNLFGRWLKMKINWQPNIKNKIRNFVVRINSTAVKLK